MTAWHSTNKGSMQLSCEGCVQPYTGGNLRRPSCAPGSRELGVPHNRGHLWWCLKSLSKCSPAVSSLSSMGTSPGPGSAALFHRVHFGNGERMKHHCQMSAPSAPGTCSDPELHLSWNFNNALNAKLSTQKLEIFRIEVFGTNLKTTVTAAVHCFPNVSEFVFTTC